MTTREQHRAKALAMEDGHAQRALVHAVLALSAHGEPPWPWEDDQAGYDDWANDLVIRAGDTWDEDSTQEHVITQYVHTLEDRLDEAGISRDRYLEPVESVEPMHEPSPALGARVIAIGLALRAIDLSRPSLGIAVDLDAALAAQGWRLIHD